MTVAPASGVQFKEGDLIQIPNLFYGLDERLTPNPLEVDFRREPVQQAAFMDCWLEWIPEFGLKPGTRPVKASGQVCVMLRLDLARDSGATRR